MGVWIMKVVGDWPREGVSGNYQGARALIPCHLILLVLAKKIQAVLIHADTFLL